MYVDLSDDKLDVWEDDGRAPADERKRHSLPLTLALDSPSLIKYQRSLSQASAGKKPGLKPEEVDEMIERADRVATALREYKVPVVPYVSDDLDEVTRAFQRVNTQGVRMSEVHMLNALSWRRDFNLLDFFDAAQARLAPKGWSSIEDSVLLRCCVVALDENPYDYKVDELAPKLKASHAQLDGVVGTLESVADALAVAVKIFDRELVPYTPQITILFDALRQRPTPSDDQVQRLADWIWFTTYVEAFAGTVNASWYDKVSDNVVGVLGGEAFEWPHRIKNERRPLPKTYDFRHARARALALLLAGRGAQKPPGVAQNAVTHDAYRLLADQLVKAVENIVPTSVKGAWRLGPGARFLVAPEDLPELRRFLAAGEPSDEFLASHVVSRASLQAFREGRYEQFVKLRAADLERLEEEHFQQVKARLGADG